MAAGRTDFLILFAGDDQGRTAYARELEWAIAQASLTDRVRIVGHCDDMPATYTLTDFTILPTTVPESFGRAAVEPQIMGRTVIAADHGGTIETVEEGISGWLVAPKDPQAWAEAIARAIDLGREGRAQMGQAGQERARRLYSAEAMCAATLAAYELVLGARA